VQGELGRGFARARLWCNRTEVRAAIVCGDTEESVDSLGAPDQAARRSAWAPGPQTRRRWAHSLPPPCPGNYTPSPLSKFNPLDAPLKGVWLSRTTFGPSALIRQLVNAGDECVADSPLLWGSPHAFAAPAPRSRETPVSLCHSRGVSGNLGAPYVIAPYLHARGRASGQHGGACACTDHRSPLRLSVSEPVARACA
jgi:hypothetical protein